MANNPKHMENLKPFKEGQDDRRNKSGRKPSIKNELKKLALSDGYLEFDAKDVQRVTKRVKDKEGNDIEKEFVKIKIPKQDALALKLWQWAMSKKGNDSIKAIQMIMEQFDGKAAQSVDLTTKGKSLNRSLEQIEKEIAELEKLDD